ncbi:MAG TPA: hypothetical protein PLE43_06410 [Alphaproteobacteria bacterium]|nr:hypothetical protein [Alphaproteobacteria bacterium]
MAQQFADQHNIAGYRITLNPTILSRRRSYEQPGWDRISLLSSYVKTRSSRLLLGDDLWENGDMVLFKGWATTRQANNDADDLLRYSNTLEGAIDKTGIGLSISMTPDFSKKYT